MISCQPCCNPKYHASHVQIIQLIESVVLWDQIMYTLYYQCHCDVQGNLPYQIFVVVLIDNLMDGCEHPIPIVSESTTLLLRHDYFTTNFQSYYNYRE